MTAESDDDIMDSLFHGCAFLAHLQIAAESNYWPPPSEPTRQRAYDLYEDALREKNRRVDGRVPLLAAVAETASEVL